MSRLDLLIARRLGKAPAAAPITPRLDTPLDRTLAALRERIVARRSAEGYARGERDVAMYTLRQREIELRARGAAMRLQAAANDAAWYAAGGTRD